MRYLDEYRARDAALRLAAAIEREARQRWTVMEVCGGQTHSIVRYGVDQLIGDRVELVHGPGCPVCVTPLETIDKAQAIASMPGVIFCSFGDMLRVPGSRGDLFAMRARGADVRIVYSPLDAVEIARKNPQREVVFFAVGFETTAPANATAAQVARRLGLCNFSLLCSHVLVPPAIGAIVGSPESRVQAFLGPGHVCSVMGVAEYDEVVARHRVPVVITGFEPVDLLEGLLMAVRQLERGEARAEIQYGRVVRSEGNSASRAAVDEVFEVTDRAWRGVGMIEHSGYRMTVSYRGFDAEHRFDVETVQARESSECISGRILRGLAKPLECPAFGKRCTPDQPLGATMVSSEGACAAYYLHGRASLVPLRSRPTPARGAAP